MTPRKIRIAICLVLFASSWTTAATHRDQTSEKAEKERDYQALAIYAPKPDYPYGARARYETGSGVALLTVGQDGTVIAAGMAVSTGHPRLDEATLSAFRKWRFKPGTVFLAKIPVTFTLTRGGQVTYELKVKKSRPMADVLASFLGKEAVIDGPIPHYPIAAAVTDKQGKGLYELHVGRDGRVTEVRILEASGDATFDRITVEALRRWRLRTGPKVIELPLAFKLTPRSYEVGIP